MTNTDKPIKKKELTANKTKKSESGQNLPVRRDWQANDMMITDCYVRYLETKNRIPTTAEIVKETGLSKNTIRSHEEQRSFKELCQQFKPLTKNVVKKHYKEIMENGNPNLIKAWYDIVEEQNKVKTEETPVQTINNMKTIIIQVVKTPEQIQEEKRNGRMIEGE